MTQSQVLILQHVPWEKPGRILDGLDDLGLSYQIMNVAKEKKPEFPDFDEVAGVVLMGGPMGALDYDKYPGLKVEAKLTRAAVSVGKPVLGAPDHRDRAWSETEKRGCSGNRLCTDQACG